jgi:tetratricopeptide (TPR) repeat protein
MIRRHAPRVGAPAELEAAQSALAEGRYEAAFATLEGAARRQRARGLQAWYWLHLAACYALYGEEGLENGVPALKAAVAADPKLMSDPLYQTLYWEFDAYRGGAASDVKRGLRSIAGSLPPIAAYHAGAALLAVGAAKSALRRLEPLSDDTLPTYLVWRRWSLLGQVHEALGDWTSAAVAYAAAVDGAPAAEREPERLAYASCLLELGRVDEVLLVVGDVDEAGLDDVDRALLRYVEGRAHLDAGNPNRALELFLEARAIDPEPEAVFSLAYATGQALSALQRFDAAVVALREAIEVAPADHRAFAQHEAAVALLESEAFDEAVPLLEEVLADPRYPHRGEALADLADVRLRAGDFEGAQADAERALDLGAIAPACLVLGALAFEYYHLDEAVRWYEQAVAASQAGEPTWVAAHQLLADVHAQRGDAAAERVLRHAVAALEHTDPASEWRLPLEAHVARARGVLGGHDRVLN